MNSIMKKFSQEITKNYSSLNQKVMKSFSTSLFTKMNKNRREMSNLNIGLNPSSISIYSKMSRGFFSSDSKNNKEKTEEEEARKTKTEEEKSKTEEKKKTDKKKEDSSDEEHNLKEQLKELKKMYDDQLKASEQLKKKFEDLRKAYLENVHETEQIKVRYDREIALTKDYAITKFSKDILEVCDNFDRALNSLNGIEFDKLAEQEKVETHQVFLEGK
jgi:molecular chaperone GrpE (heat shock protein)